MNRLTILVFILCLGSISCFTEWVTTTPEISEKCRKQEDVGDKDIRKFRDRNVKCYYHCVYENQGIIQNGLYVGNFSRCDGIKDADKCELALKVIWCTVLRRGG